MQQENTHSDIFVSGHSDDIRKRLVQFIGGERGWQVRIARETGIGRSYLSQLINGKRGLLYRHLKLIAGSCRANIDWLLTGQGHMDDISLPPSPPHGVKQAQVGGRDAVDRLLDRLDRSIEHVTNDERTLVDAYRGLSAGQRSLMLAIIRNGGGQAENDRPQVLNDSARPEMELLDLYHRASEEVRRVGLEYFRGAVLGLPEDRAPVEPGAESHHSPPRVKRK